MTHIAAGVLAAGAGTRMGRPKAEIVVDGARLVDRAVLALREAGCHPIFAVVRAGTSVPGATAVVNPAPARGMRSSLDLAVTAAAAASVDALAITLVDAPGIGSSAITAVTRAWTPGRIAMGRYAGRGGHPIVMSPSLWRAALDLAGPDEGARALLAERADLVDAIDAAGDLSDLDTPDDLRHWTGG